MRTIVVTTRTGSYEDLEIEIAFVAIFPDSATNDDINDALRLGNRDYWTETVQYNFVPQTKQVYVRKNE